MPEYTANAIQTVPVNGNVLFTETPVPCTLGLVRHREGSGVFTLRPDNTGCPYKNKSYYKVTFGANIAVPAGTAAQPISIALALDGEPIPASSAIVSPPNADRYFNVMVSFFVDVSRPCCEHISVRNTSTIPIEVQNANLIIEK